MKHDGKFEKALIAKLSVGEMDESALKRYSRSIAQLHKNEFVIDDVCKYGIPVDHGVCVKGIIEIDRVASLVELFKIPNSHNFKLFTKGIIDPTALEFEFRIGAEAAGR